jgi:hypothetical protein
MIPLLGENQTVYNRTSVLFVKKNGCRPEALSRLDKRRERAINDARRYIAKLLKL